MVARRYSTRIRAVSSRALNLPVLLKENGVSISMDGKGCWRDNVFVERLWKTIKYEEVYLKAYDSISDARGSLQKYLDFYNQMRPHSAHGGCTPNEMYREDSEHLPDAA